MENLIKVYVKLDENKIITQINSSIFLNDTTNWVEIDEGQGDKYAHCQCNYLPKSLVDENYKYNYKYDNGLVELTDEEKETLFPTLIPKPTNDDVLDILLGVK